MKTMTCKQLGGACDMEFSGNTFEEVAMQSKKHGGEMFQAKEVKHLEAMNKMMDLMQSPDGMKNWMDNKRREFDALDDNK